jgi:predicted enzyme related to lactoylglutathione lyase
MAIFLDHTIVHFEIPAEDLEKQKKFYGELFGWKIEKYPGPGEYYLLQTVPVDDNMMPIRAGVNGGLFKKTDQMTAEQAKPTNYIWVESVEEYSKKVEQLGGKIIVPKMEIPGLGWWALALDPEGNHFGLLEYMQR